MAKAKSTDPFICNEPAIEIGPATSRILKQRIKTADEGRLVSAEKPASESSNCFRPFPKARYGQDS